MLCIARIKILYHYAAAAYVFCSLLIITNNIISENQASTISVLQYYDNGYTVMRLHVNYSPDNRVQTLFPLSSFQ